MKRIVIGLLLLTVISLGAPMVASTGSSSMTAGQDRSCSQAITSQTYTTRYSIEIYNNGEMEAMAISESWDGDGTAEHPYVITGYRLTATDTQPIRIWNVDLYWEFVNNIIEWGAVCGTYFNSAENGLIENNTIHGRHSGMVISNCANIIVRNNIVENNTANGIEIFLGGVNITLEGNKVSENAGAGIYMPLSNGFVVSQNVITRSGGSGIETVGFMDSIISDNTINASGEHGMDLYSITDSKVTHNVVEDSGINGIYIESGSENFVSKNWIENSTSHGVSLDSDCINTTVRGNVLIDTGALCQACDNGTNNEFAYNYFDDWISPDVDSDGYVDTPYSVAGTAANEDPYPRTGPGVDVPCRFTTTTSTTTSTTTTTTTTTETPPMDIMLILGAGGVGAIVVVLAVVLVRRR